MPNFLSNLPDGLVIFQILCPIFIYLLYKWSTATFDYWEKRKVPTPNKPFPLVGNLGKVVRNELNIGYLWKKMCDENVQERFFGIYMTRKPVLILNDAELVMHVVLKDFSLFNDKGFDPDTDFDMICNNIFFVTGSRWRFQRNKFSPAFTSGKLKSMFSQINQCSTSFVSYLTKLSANKDSLEMDLKASIEDLFTDIVCKNILGLNMHSIETPNKEYMEIQCAVLKPNWRLHAKQVLLFLSPFIDRKIRITEKRIEDWFYGFAKENLKVRAENKIQRNDLLQTLINVYGEYHEVDVKSEEYFGLRHLAANIFVFIAAGFETSALTTTFLLHKMALYPEVQERLRREILDVRATKGNGNLEYEDYKKMPYLRMVLNEILRMYPVLPMYMRRTVVPYKIPGSDVCLDAGTYIMVPTVAMHYSPKYWKDPQAFDPERFSEENKGLIVPGSYIPFSEGPRQCIGMRFAYLQMNSAICEILSHFEIRRSSKTVEDTDFVVGSMVMVPKEELIADFIPRKFY